MNTVIKMMLKESKSLFAHNIFSYHIDPKSYNKQSIVDTINSNYSKQKDRNSYDNMNIVQSDIHHSYNDVDNKKLPSPDYSSLLPVYENVFKELYSNLQFKEGIEIKYHFQVVNYTCTNKNQFMRKHWHMPSADFSCIHYLQFDEEHSSTVFYNPGDNKARSYTAIRPAMVDNLDMEHYSNSGYAEVTAPIFKEDDMIVFPGYLDHEIPSSKYQYKRNRITIVTNTWLEDNNV